MAGQARERGGLLPRVGAPYVARSRGRETTFQHNLEDWDEVREQVAQLARRVGEDVAKEDRTVIRVVVKVRYAPFFTSTHGHSLPSPTIDAAAIAHAAQQALEMFTDRRPVRLLGVRAELSREAHARRAGTASPAAARSAGAAAT